MRANQPAAAAVIPSCAWVNNVLAALSIEPVVPYVLAAFSGSRVGAEDARLHRTRCLSFRSALPRLACLPFFLKRVYLGTRYSHDLLSECEESFVRRLAVIWRRLA